MVLFQIILQSLKFIYIQDPIYNIMKLRTWLIFCILVLATMQAKQKPKQVLEVDQQTVISFVIQQQASNHNQILKLKLEISKRDASLVDAIQSSNDLRQELTDIFEKFCERFNQTCGDDIETSSYDIEAEYYHLRGEETFKTFVVKFQMDFIFANYQSVGLLLEDFEPSIIDNNIVIRGIEWEDLSDEMTLEQVIDEGVERAKRSCESLGMKLFKIKSVEQQQEESKQKQPPKKEESQEQDEQEEQEEEEEQATTQQDQSEKYKFVAVCRSYKPKSKKSQSKKITEVNTKTKKIKQQ